MWNESGKMNTLPKMKIEKRTHTLETNGDIYFIDNGLPYKMENRAIARLSHTHTHFDFSRADDVCDAQSFVILYAFKRNSTTESTLRLL